MNGFIYKIMKRNTIGNWRPVPNLPSYHSREEAEAGLLKYDPDSYKTLKFLSQYTIHRTFER